MRLYFLLLFVWVLPMPAAAQLLGGKSVFSFLELPASPQITALGQVNVSQQTADITLAALNPALLRAGHHSQLAAGYARYFGDVQYVHAMGGYHAAGLGTTVAAGIQHISYGNLAQTDASGNVTGTF